jgi:hypothetical protein
MEHHLLPSIQDRILVLVSHMLLTIIFMMRRSALSQAGPSVIRQPSPVSNFHITFTQIREQRIGKDMRFSVRFRVERSAHQQLSRFQILICHLIQEITFSATERTHRMMVKF